MAQLVDSRGLAQLKKMSLDKLAVALAESAVNTGAAIAAATLNFLKDDDEADGDFIAKLTVTVERP